MFDSPRFSSKLASLLEEAGGIDFMVLSHKDLVEPQSFEAIRAVSMFKSPVCPVAPLASMGSFILPSD